MSSTWTLTRFLAVSSNMLGAELEMRTEQENDKMNRKLAGPQGSKDTMQQVQVELVSGCY